MLRPAWTRTCNHSDDGDGQRPSDDDHESSNNDNEPSNNDREPSNNDREPSNNDHEPRNNYHEPSADDHESSADRHESSDDHDADWTQTRSSLQLVLSKTTLASSASHASKRLMVSNVCPGSYPFDRIKQLYDINVHGAFFTAREAARSMIPQGGGSIVLVANHQHSPGSYCARPPSSTFVLIIYLPQPQTPYNASKAGTHPSHI
ncbi:hypothetical protein BDZ89DRAFT_1146298 [Hymenopellis radicata]|nr:hypothetical protein BDZ89DRAFT_1146298 [Hymenopellis radicata]